MRKPDSNRNAAGCLTTTASHPAAPLTGPLLTPSHTAPSDCATPLCTGAYRSTLGKRRANYLTL
ncbi:MAG: hypothetical protein AMXMBFR26_20100 [Porticoccaceae bacterium]